MFCPNCGKQVKDYDNFCKYCGAKVNEEARVVSSIEKYESKPDENKSESDKTESSTVKTETTEPLAEEQFSNEHEEEFVIYDVKKHYMALFWPIVMTPIFFLYFWQIFLNTHSFFSWVITFVLLAPIVYPILRYTSDKIIITSKYIRIKMGIFNIEEIDIPIKKANLFTTEQTLIGRMLNYGSIIFKSPAREESTIYSYIKDFDELQGFIEDPAQFIKECLEEDV